MYNRRRKQSPWRGLFSAKYSMKSAFFLNFFSFFVSTNQYIFERLSLRACLFVGVLWTRPRRDYVNLSGKSLHIYVPLVTMWLLVDKFYMKTQKSWFLTGDLIGFFTLKIPERKAQTKYAEYKTKANQYFLCAGGKV